MQGHGCWKAFLSERKLLNAILRVKLKYMKISFSWNEMLFAMQKTDFHVLELFCRASHVRASMHRITSLELLRTLMLCLVQLSKWRECKATDAEKLLSQWEKVAKCNFKSKAQVHERCFFSWNEMLFAMQKTDFHVLELFCRASHVRASMHRITSLELLRTLMLCLVQLSKWRNARPRMLKSFFLSERKLLNAILRVKLKYMKDVSFSWNEMLFAMQKTDFHVLELFCRASHVRASMHRITSLELLRTLMLCLVQLSKWRECKATDAEKLLSQRESC